MTALNQELRTLYSISKLLSRFVSIEETFPKLFTLIAEAFPLLTVVLIEHWEKDVKTFIWQAPGASSEAIDDSVYNARGSYIYLVGELESPKAIWDSTKVLSEEQSYIVLPLLIDNLPPHGVIQFKGASTLNETHLNFINALTDLLCVALDRFYKTKLAALMNVKSEEKVTSLEVERATRELFVSMLTHDLRTPMSAALMAAQLIQRKAKDPEAVLNLVGRVINNINRADHMVTDLLDANLLNTGQKLPLDLKEFDLSGLIRDTVEELTTVHGNRFEFKPTQPVDGVWDQKGLRRIVENLCNNAIKYGDPHAPIQLKLWQNDNDVFFSVQNFGTVISKENQKTLFEQFSRVAPTQTTKKGWGIGLTLVRGVAEAHGGGVSVESRSELGTVFTVNLPRHLKLSF